MKKLMILCSLIVMAAGSAFAQADVGDLGIFANADGSGTSACPTPFTTANTMYGVIFGTDIAAWEAQLAIDPNVVVLATVFNPPTAINVGTVPDYIVGTGTCLNQVNGAVSFVSFTYGIFLPVIPNDLLACVGVTTPASIPGTPAYIDCADNLLPAGLATNGGGVYPDGCFVFCPSAEPPVATASSSFGAVKGKF